MKIIRKTNAAMTRKILCTAVSLALVPISGAVSAQQDQVEEVVVTGT